jgi:hypothetical protein
MIAMKTASNLVVKAEQSEIKRCEVEFCVKVAGPLRDGPVSDQEADLVPA